MYPENKGVFAHGLLASKYGMNRERANERRGKARRGGTDWMQPAALDWPCPLRPPVRNRPRKYPLAEGQARRGGEGRRGKDRHRFGPRDVGRTAKAADGSFRHTGRLWISLNVVV